MENKQFKDISLLFLKTPITTLVKRNPPVVAVGLPGSGSSFLVKKSVTVCRTKAKAHPY